MVDKTLYKRLLDAANDGKLPILDNKSFERLNAEYGKEIFRETLAEYIATERPVFPLKEISYDNMRDSFGKLKKFNTATICIPQEQIEKEVYEKYDDYEYEKLKILVHIPKEFKLERDECNDDDDNYFSYNISYSDTEEDDNPIVSDEKIVEKESSDIDINLDDI